MRRAWFLALLCAITLPLASRAENSTTHFANQMHALEQDSGGRIGVAALDTATGQRLSYRADERFAMCSTFKLLLAADILSGVDQGHDHLDQSIAYTPSDLLEYAPITKKYVGLGSMTIGELSAAAITYSDNTAANLLLQHLGGPQALTHYLRGIGDAVTRLDRTEPDLNTNLPSDMRDTTTPTAMLITMQKLLTGRALTPTSRTRLVHWLIANTTGDTKLRAGIDPSWTIGDKTGTGSNGAANDIAIIWPPNHKPILIAVYTTGSDSSAEGKNAVIAKIGQLVSTNFYTP